MAAAIGHFINRAMEPAPVSKEQSRREIRDFFADRAARLNILFSTLRIEVYNSTILLNTCTHNKSIQDKDIAQWVGSAKSVINGLLHQPDRSLLCTHVQEPVRTELLTSVLSLHQTLIKLVTELRPDQLQHMQSSTYATLIQEADEHLHPKDACSVCSVM